RRASSSAGRGRGRSSGPHGGELLLEAAVFGSLGAEVLDQRGEGLFAGADDLRLLLGGALADGGVEDEGEPGEALGGGGDGGRGVALVAGGDGGEPLGDLVPAGEGDVLAPLRLGGDELVEDGEEGGQVVGLGGRDALQQRAGEVVLGAVLGGDGGQPVEDGSLAVGDGGAPDPVGGLGPAVVAEVAGGGEEDGGGGGGLAGGEIDG